MWHIEGGGVISISISMTLSYSHSSDYIVKMFVVAEI